MKLGILLTSGPESPDINTAVRTAQAALDQGVEVEFFLMMDGVRHVNAGKLDRLARAKVPITFCAHNAGERGVEVRDGFASGSQYDLARLTASADKMLTL